MMNRPLRETLNSPANTGSNFIQGQSVLLRSALIMALVAASVALLLAACGGAAAPAATPSPASAPAPVADNPATSVPTPVAETPATSAPAPTSTAAPTNTSAPTAAPSATTVPTAAAIASLTEPAQASGGSMVAIGDGTLARYLVREQLARLDFPNDAIGETAEVSGAIAFAADGAVQSDASKIVVQLASLESDSGRRDGYVRSRSLETDTYPLAEFVVRQTPGLPWPLPTSGEAAFQMVGDMTLHGVTRPLTWDVTAQFGEGTVSGLAKTNFTFGEFEMDIPSVRVVLSVEDDIRLELDFQASVTP